MKPIIVNVQVQLDIPETGDPLNHVLNALDNINMQLYREHEENYNMQIFVSSITNSDLLEVASDEEEEEDDDEE